MPGKIQLFIGGGQPDSNSLSQDVTLKGEVFKGF